MRSSTHKLRSDVKDKHNNVKNPEVSIRPLRSPHSVSSSKSSNSAVCGSLDKQNGTLSSDTDGSILCTPEVQSSIKECNVFLRKDEVEKYIASSNSAEDSLIENNLSEEEFEKDSTKQNKSKRATSPTTVSKKR